MRCSGVRDPAAGPEKRGLAGWREGFKRPDRFLGAGRELDRCVTTHLFGIVLSHSGSTFLQMALATCRAMWNLRSEGQFALGYCGPVAGRGRLADVRGVWASRRRWRDALADPAAYDWPRIRKARYFQAFARDPGASVFFTKSPPHLLVVQELARQFPNPKFLFMVRNPYAVCEGICRNLVRRGLAPADRTLDQAAGRHVVACLRHQRRNAAAYRDHGLLVRYESMCAEPERVASQIQALVPALDDLDLRRRLPVMGQYHEMLTDMNTRQIARLEPGRIATCNRVFRPHRDLLAHFGYALLADDSDGGIAAVAGDA